MDIKRLFLLIPLALLAYLIIVQWNKDYGQPVTAHQAPPTVTNQQNSEPSGSADSALSAPSQPASNDGLAGSLPGQVPVQAATNSRDLIAITTDVLDLRIDPVGGDVVYAALLKHDQTQEGDQPFVLLNIPTANKGGSYYTAKSGLSLSDYKGRIDYTSQEPEYRLAKGDDQLDVALTANINGVDVIKRFELERDSYAVKVSYHLANESETPVTARFIGQLVRDNSPDPSSGPKMGMKSFLGAAFSSPDTRYEKINFDDIQEGKVDNRDAKGGWVAMIQHYFTTAWAPPQNQQNLYYTSTDAQGRNLAVFAGPNVTVAPGSNADLEATLYMGPKVQKDLKEVAPNLELTVDFGWLWFIANPLFWLLEKIHSLIGNWGWSIVLLTVMVKAALWPLSAKAYKSMGRMRKLGPEMQRLKEQFGDDRQKMSQEMMKFYQKEKINPLGGCLPILIQMPVFIALYWMLLESVELRHAPFMFWIHDLSVKDPYFILPILMGASMFVQQMLNPTPPDPTQAKIMKMLPIVFTFFFLWFPAGLVIYWVTNNVISIAQQYYITRQIENDPSVGKGLKTK
ncbi:membrane protein insertase YidC [Halomonas halocynthiae]|uniref:membrane protein insertase YidC n=1 Tax=Halomonas halocynthiae TaxID=176290 RepID=UPI0004176F5B|nr:membrane protein insertase YidC [Halomonas halocynthiae]